MDATIGDQRAAPSVEEAFDRQPVPGSWNLVTLRAMGVAVVLGIIVCLVVMKIQMTAGIVPALNMPSSILSFFLVKWLIKLQQSCGFLPLPFTRQENMFLLTCVTTCLNLSMASGFAANIMAMTSAVAKTLSDNPDPRDVIDNISIGKLMVFFFLIGLTGIMSTIPLHRVMIIDYRLLFPTGSIIAQLINSFHTPEGAYVAKLQVATIVKVFLGSFSWSTFQWFYTAGDNCGFQHFPTFGLELYKHNFSFDFSASYVGLGMICPHIVNFGLLFGAIISWGFIYPFLENKRGQWYETDSPTNLNGSNGYKVFISVTLIITDGLINFITLIITAALNFYQVRQEREAGLANYFKKHPSLNYDDRKRIEVFMANRIKVSIPIIGYIACTTISTIVIPLMFNQIKSYIVLVIYIIIPVIGFCNTYATGLTDWSVAPTYAKFTTFVVAAWIGKPGAVIAGLVAAGIIIGSLHISSQAMQDLKSGHLTLTSARAMVIGQIFGAAVASVVTPCIFLAFRSTAKPDAPIGSKNSEYPCPLAGLYRAIGVIGTGGVKELPKHCLTICFVAFCITVVIDALVLVSQKKGWSIHNYIPSMTVIALPFFAGTSFTIDMCMGSVLLYVWTRINIRSAEMLSSSVAAGLICGEGLFTLPAALLNMIKVRPPMCMKFLPSGEDAAVVDSYLNTLETPIRA